jgi:hypothetical protein
MEGGGERLRVKMLPQILSPGIIVFNPPFRFKAEAGKEEIKNPGNSFLAKCREWTHPFIIVRGHVGRGSIQALKINVLKKPAVSMFFGRVKNCILPLWG